jgi:hypothetical protein
LRVRERDAQTAFAKITAASRTLVEHGYRIVIDASQNSVEPEASGLVLEMEEMSREVLLRAASFKRLFDRLEAAGLDEVVWQTVAGVPSALATLDVMLENKADESIRPIVEAAVMACLNKALDVVLDCSAEVETKLLPLFEERAFVLKSEAKRLGIVFAARDLGPNKVLRARIGQSDLAPGSTGVAFVLRHRLNASNERLFFDHVCRLAKLKS